MQLNLLKALFSRTNKQKTLDLGNKHKGFNAHELYSNNGHRLTFELSTYFPMRVQGKTFEISMFQELLNADVSYLSKVLYSPKARNVYG